ncbi:hypothetical protein PSHT_09765 [Puccinia striiformis]|uniref:GRAM domain-containing protein n=1 Tax=Puccinia striiformis TaxID=27350 RepID=A0A2S4VEM9_9BASI|nr:hypothetical protein PSHT_09765 [Puccinia striiformis]
MDLIQEPTGPSERGPPPLPPRPLHTVDSHAPGTQAIDDAEHSRNLKTSNVNLPFDEQASTPASAAKPPQDTLNKSIEAREVSSSDQTPTWESEQHSTIPDPFQSDSSQQSAPVKKEQSGDAASHQTHTRVKSESDVSCWLDSTPDDVAQEPDYALDTYNDTLAEIEGIEVSEFLKRTSKYLNEVNFSAGESESAPVSIPTLDDFRSSTGVIDWVGFCNAYAAAQLDRYCPNVLHSSPTRASVSISQLKAHASRSYVAILPGLWDIIAGNQLSDVYRWENPQRTTFYLVTYYLLWAADLIPSFIVGYILYLLLDRQLNPPTISQLKQEVSHRHQLGKQAETIGSGGFWEIKNDTSGSVSKSLLGNSIVLAGVALGANVPSTGTSAAGPAPSSSLPKKSDYRGLYSFSRSLYSDHGHEIQDLLADLADIGEKVRNLYLWRRPQACWRASFMLIVVLLYTLAISQKWLIKNILGWLGIEFFFLLGFTDKYPKFRKILNPIWLILYDIPTDSEFALQVLQERGKNSNPSLNNRKLFNKHHHHHSHFLHKKSRSASSLSDQKPENSIDASSSNSSATQRQRGSIIPSDGPLVHAVRSVPGSDKLKRWSQKVAHGTSGAVNLAKKIYAGGHDEAPHSEPQSNLSESNDLLDHNVSYIPTKTFAILNGKVPGNLTVHKAWMCFEALRGFRTKTTNLKSTLINPIQFHFRYPRESDHINTLFFFFSSSSSLSSSMPNSNEPQRKSSGGEQIIIRGSDTIEEEAGDEEEKDDDDDDDDHNVDLTDFSADGTISNITRSDIIIIQFKEIIKIKKVKRSVIFGLGFRMSDGIEFHLDNSTVLSFDNIINRDEYFNHLLLLCSHHSPK